MGWLFHTPSDDTTEATLRGLHMANTLDNYFVSGWGWARTLRFSDSAGFIPSFAEKTLDISLWDRTVEWFIEYAQDKVNGWT